MPPSSDIKNGSLDSFFSTFDETELVECFNSVLNTETNLLHFVKEHDCFLTYQKQKIRKYGKAAEENHLRLCPATFSTTGEMGPSIKKLFLEQIRLKLQLVDGEVKRSKVQKIMKHCVRHISAAINRSASRNIFLKVTKMVNLARHTQQNFSSSTFCDSTSSSASFSPDELVQQLELQIMNQDVIQN